MLYIVSHYANHRPGSLCRGTDSIMNLSWIRLLRGLYLKSILTNKHMKKVISVQRVLMLSIVLTGDKERDFIGLKDYDFEGLCPMETQVRDMIRMSHEPKIFVSNEKGVFSHSLGEDNILSIWKEDIELEDAE